MNTVGSYECRCRSGYSMIGTNCTNINECEVGSHDCSPAATCVDTEGSYRCECPPGYIWHRYYRSCRENPHYTFTGTANLSAIPNHVTDITFEDVPIENIHLEVFSNSRNISSLNFRYNGIMTTKPEFWVHLNSLTQLRIEFNPLTSLVQNSFLTLEDLQALYLTNNNISVIEKGAFNGLKMLRRLYLYNNNISHLVPGTFLGLIQLKYLDLSQNHLETIEWNVFDPKFSAGKQCIGDRTWRGQFLVPLQPFHPVLSIVVYG